MTKRGMKFDYVQGIDVSEFNYAPYVQQLKDKGVKARLVHRRLPAVACELRQAMEQQGYEPDIYLRDPTDYNPEYVEQGGSAVDGTWSSSTSCPSRRPATNTEMQLYLSWLQQVEARRRADLLRGLRLVGGPALRRAGRSRSAASSTGPSLIDALRKVDNWTANGLHAPQHVGTKRTGECWRFIQLKRRHVEAGRRDQVHLRRHHHGPRVTP